MSTLPPCARVDADYADRVFFGVHEDRQVDVHHQAEIEAARYVCDACPIARQCLDDALRIPARLDVTGIRAGTLPAERQALRVRWKVTVKATGEEWRGGPT